MKEILVLRLERVNIILVIMLSLILEKYRIYILFGLINSIFFLLESIFHLYF